MMKRETRAGRLDNLWVNLKTSNPDPYESVLVWCENYTYPFTAYIDRDDNWFQEVISGPGIKLESDDVEEICFYIPYSSLQKYFKPPRG